MEINSLVDLNSFRTAPDLSKSVRNTLYKELEKNIINADWITVGIMAFHDYEAIKALKSISSRYASIQFRGLEALHETGNVFLKGNQKTGNVFIRSESGLGEGILITCQYEENSARANTFGPLPLDFFTY